MSGYSQDQIYQAMRQADAAGDGEAVKKLATLLQSGASKQQINDAAAQSGLTVDQTTLDANIASRDAGGPVSRVLPPTRPTATEQFGAATQNALAGASQGALGGLIDLPLDMAAGVQKGANALIGHGGAAALGAVGLEGASNWLSKAATARDANIDGRVRVTDEIERLSPTPEGMGGARLASQLLGGMAVPFGPKATPRIAAPKPVVANEAREVIEAGQREGVRVMTSDVRPPRTFIGKFARATGERIPFAGTGGVRVAQNEERIEAVKGLARDFGVEGGQEVLDSVTDDLAKTRGGKIAALAKRKNGVIDGLSGKVETPQAVSEIDRQIARLSGINDQKLAPVIRELERFKTALTSGKSLREIEENRRLLGEMFEDQSLAAVKGVGQKAINAIYAPLRDDMGAFIKANGGQKAFIAWKQSNDELAAMAGELDANAFKRTLQNADTTPENVASLLFSKKPSDVRRLYANLSNAGKEKAKAAVLHEAITKAGGIDEVSPQKFANALKAFGKTTGIIFGDDAPRIEGIVKLLRATQQASVAGAAPVTGAQNAPVIGAAALGSWMGSVSGTVTAAGLAGAAARLYESAAVRNLLLGLGRSKPGSRAEASYIERIERMLASQTGINPPSALNDNVGVAAAAEPPTESR